MENLETGEPRWELVFDRDGILKAPLRDDFFDELALSGVNDLFVFSHGWNNDAVAATRLYDDMFSLIRDACEGAGTLGPIGFAGVYWPSVWFPETPAVVPSEGGSGQADEGIWSPETSGSDALTGAEIAESLLSSFASKDERAAIQEIGDLIDQGAAALADDSLTDNEQEQLIGAIHERARLIVSSAPVTEQEDSAETTVFSSTDPRKTYPYISEVFGTTPPEGDTEGVGDWFRKALEGSKDMMRVLSYTVMKHRAGTVGSVGLGALLALFSERVPRVRVHLVGHSFGARLVSFSLSTVGQPEKSPVHSLSLIQGAFSHFSFSHAEDNPFGSPGALHIYTDRVRGPLVATYSVFDYAVCRWYPKASLLSGEDAEAAQTPGQWDGMGADGFRAVDPLVPMSLLAEGTVFNFHPNKFYRVDSAWVIDDVDQSAFSGAHSDIRKVPVAELIAAAAGAHI